MPIEKAEVTELVCDNPSCRRTQYEGPYNSVPGYLMDVVEYTADGRNYKSEVWACRPRCIGPAVREVTEVTYANRLDSNG